MGFSWIFLGLVQAAEPVSHWSPGVAQLGHEGLVSGEIDSHAGLDWVATYSSGDTSGLAIRLSSMEEDWIVPLEQQVSSIRLRLAQWDEDADQELLIGLPDYEGRGAAVVLDLGALQAAPATVEEAASLWIDGSEDGAQFGWDLLLSECSGHSGKELLVSAPFSRLDGTVYAFTSGSEASLLGNWSVKWEGSGRFGLALHALETQSSSDLLVGSCDYDPDLHISCASNGQLWQISMSQCEGTVQLNESEAILGGLLGLPSDLKSLDESSISSSPAVLWSPAGTKAAVGLSDPQVLFELESLEDAGAFMQTEEEEIPQSWLASSGRVWKISGGLGESSIEDESQRFFEIGGGDSLGLQLSPAGDMDEDGCPDVLASSVAGESLWLLSGCEAEPDDTGQGGDTGQGDDTGQGGDTGDPKDTGRPGDTGADPGDTGELPCESSFGWSCAAGVGFGRSQFICLLAGLFCLNRRRKMD